MHTCMHTHTHTHTHMHTLFHLILSVQCRCSGGCPDHLEECKSCEPGYQGSYCQEGS